MIPIVMEATWKQASVNADSELARYARWEYGTSDAGFLLAAGATGLAATSPRARKSGPSLRTRLRYWLNSFRGYAAFDVRGAPDPADR